LALEKVTLVRRKIDVPQAKPTLPSRGISSSSCRKERKTWEKDYANKEGKAFEGDQEK
tara:strand:+ start:11856 stop:12029 length:174 start_codon:yes stop_codon:yes gene_type:complete